MESKSFFFSWLIWHTRDRSGFSFVGAANFKFNFGETYHPFEGHIPGWTSYSETHSTYDIHDMIYVSNISFTLHNLNHIEISYTYI